MGNPAGLLFLGLVVIGILGITFVTIPGLEYMFGAATDTGDASMIGVIAWIVILWLSTGFFVFGCLIGGSVLTLVVTFGD